MTVRTLVASDLDQTLIYSRRSARLPEAELSDLTCVEIYDGAPQSFMTPAAARMLAALPGSALFVPVTTRTVEQLRRVRLPRPGAAPHHAIAANGGVLLVDGVPDGQWSAQVASALGASAPLDLVATHVEAVCRPDWARSVRRAGGLFCYAVIDRATLPDRFVDDESAWADGHGWRVSLQGRKIYWVPRSLTKSAAVREVARRTGARSVLAAGDSLLDLDLLECADLAIRPAHGELHDSGWSASHARCTERAGARAGEEIVRWFLETAAATPTAGRRRSR
ncbi:HAD family hydrolase [Speluncibacter jeojiensis]|uniref:HAD family hydrolase n=1 Tax=Speluncibacter jeojiensis TaxID=2710754 RepID=UPI00240FDA20|nr:HAD family hydrolase [Rhodococcus sp. D2-41]